MSIHATGNSMMIGHRHENGVDGRDARLVAARASPIVPLRPASANFAHRAPHVDGADRKQDQEHDHRARAEA